MQQREGLNGMDELGAQLRINSQSKVQGYGKMHCPAKHYLSVNAVAQRGTEFLNAVLWLVSGESLDFRLKRLQRLSSRHRQVNQAELLDLNHLGP